MSTTLSFDPLCASCSIGHGVPKRIGFTGDERTITYECASCSHRWTATDHVHRPIALDPLVPPQAPDLFQSRNRERTTDTRTLLQGRTQDHIEISDHSAVSMFKR